MGLATESDSIGIYKAYIKDANGLKNPVFPSLFSKSNEFNLGSISSFLPTFTVVEELLIVHIHIYLQVIYIYGQQHYYTRHISALTKMH